LKSKVDFLSVYCKIINANASTWLLNRKLGRKKDCTQYENTATSHCNSQQYYANGGDQGAEKRIYFSAVLSQNSTANFHQSDIQ